MVSDERSRFGGIKCTRELSEGFSCSKMFHQLKYIHAARDTANTAYSGLL